MLYAALDWSGTAANPIERGELYVPCAVRVKDAEAVEVMLSDWRRELALTTGFEFHGYKLRLQPDILLRFAQWVHEHAQVTALLLDKYALTEILGPNLFGKPTRLPPLTARLILRRVLAHGPLHKVWLDEDIAKPARPEFNTHIKREARARWSISPDIKHLPSHKSSLIHLADVTVYLLQREAHGLSETAEISRLVKAFWKNSRNEIRWGRGDDLRPYLLP